MPSVRELRERLDRRLDPRAHRPLLPPRPTMAHLARRLLPDELFDRAMATTIRDDGHGYDPFGMHRGGVAMGLVVTRFLYERYFRVSSHGIEHIPPTGPVILAANHSGTLPLDAMMIWTDVVRRAAGGRVPRVVMDHFVPSLPWVSILFTGGGGFGGSRGNFHALLDAGELIIVFPEGTPGIGKPFSERYQLRPFREGFAELAIRHQVTVVPVGVVGAEEQWPQLTRIEGIHAFGAPYLPVPATPLPLPVHYHLWYGPPIPVAGRWRPEDAYDADAVGVLAGETQEAVAALLARGLAARAGVFR